MEALGLLLVFVGLGAAYAGVTGHDVLGMMRQALGGAPPKPDTPSPLAGAASAAPAAAQGPQKLTGAGGQAPPGGSALTAMSPYGPIPVKPTGTVPDPSDLDLVEIGQGSHRLTRAAAFSYEAASANVGHRIRVTDSYRSHAQEQDLARRKPGAGVPGYSLHEVGMAIDVDNPDWMDPTVIAALTKFGWIRWNPTGDAVHWSYFWRG